MTASRYRLKVCVSISFSVNAMEINMYLSKSGSEMFRYSGMDTANDDKHGDSRLCTKKSLVLVSEDRRISVY